MGLESRTLALYLGFAVAGLFMAQRRKLSWSASIMLLVPILADALTQLPGWRESTNVLRVLTGMLGGVGLAGLTMSASAQALSRRREEWSYRAIHALAAGVLAMTFFTGYYCMLLPIGVGQQIWKGMKEEARKDPPPPVVPASLPADIRIVPPSPDVPPHLAMLSGKWIGQWDDVLDHVFVVESVRPTGATVVLAYGAARAWGIYLPSWTREEGRFFEGSLKLSTAGPLARAWGPRSTVSYRIQPNGTLVGTLEWERGVAHIEMTRVTE